MLLDKYRLIYLCFTLYTTFTLIGEGLGTDYNSPSYIGQTVIMHGPPKLINYFHQLPLYQDYYFAYLPTYIECVITRTLPGEGYIPEVRNSCLAFTALLGTYL